MFIRLSTEDMTLLMRGIAALIAFIILGVAAAEYQLNSLTMHSTVQSFNIKREQGIYSFYILGQGGSMSALYPFATVEQSRRQITLKKNDYSVRIPTLVQIDMQKAEYWLKRWRGQFVDEAYKTKNNLAAYGREFSPWLEGAYHWAKDQISSIRQMLAGNRQ